MDSPEAPEALEEPEGVEVAKAAGESVVGAERSKREATLCKQMDYLIIIIMITPLGPWAVRSIYIFTCFSSRGLASRVFLKLKVPAARMFCSCGPVLY
jgi:hypothetical protein